MKKTYKVILQIKYFLETIYGKNNGITTGSKRSFLFFSSLQMTDVELDERITALEENDVNGNGKAIALFNMMQGGFTKEYLLYFWSFFIS